ncbi:MAG: hypothetical protein DBX90_15545 [Lentisphaerae bacterium]|nr:MAG: hypothetical protein DBX90_15545 [Lentisphaerota bacterium]
MAFQPQPPFLKPLGAARVARLGEQEINFAISLIFQKIDHQFLCIRGTVQKGRDSKAAHIGPEGDNRSFGFTEQLRQPLRHLFAHGIEKYAVKPF